MSRKSTVFSLAFGLLAILLSPVAQAAEGKSRVTILGVEHTAQLVSEQDQPGILTAFIDWVKPSAICIERPPEQAARGDYYEFTYEVQGIILPHAAARAIALCPIDWMPPVEDQQLGFGLDLETPIELRKEQGFQGFLSFPDPKLLSWDFLSGDDAAVLAPLQKWAGEPAARADRDLPRRLYLYRTFLQAQRIRAVARQRPGETILVVVGYFHKPDIEAILRNDPAIELVSASEYGRPDDAAVAAATTPQHRAAILAFNLLGMQARTGNVNHGWVARVIKDFGGDTPSAEAQLFAARHALMRGALSLDQAAVRYRAIADDSAAAAAFTWDGIKDRSRLDSFFDPFGNLTVAQRARIELARTLFAQGKTKAAEREVDQLRASLTARKAFQLQGYLPLLQPVKG